ncbi:MAG TPA: hypothetical protein DD856_04495 [Sulfobacillus sp.]|nr:hypothetical protein [Sulfobacillus sp.]
MKGTMTNRMGTWPWLFLLSPFFAFIRGAVGDIPVKILLVFLAATYLLEISNRPGGWAARF